MFGDLGKLFHEYGATFPQPVDDVSIVDDLVPHIDGCPENFDGTLHDFDGTVNAGTKTSGIGK